MEKAGSRAPSCARIAPMVMLQKQLEEELGKAVRILPPDVEALIRSALENERSVEGRMVLSRIVENIDLAKKGNVPLCQDCGMFLCLVQTGRDVKTPLGEIERQIVEACMNASRDAWYRKSVVCEPVYERINTKDNMPPVIIWEAMDGNRVTVDVLLKGFGSENCSSVRMIRPTDGEDGVVNAVLDMVRQAGGKPCPPMFLGVGLGGTMDKAAALSKKALARPAGSRNHDGRYARLEERLLESVNRLGIGPGGLGGGFTCLSVAVEQYPTHIAGLPVALSVNCWADRRAHVEVFDET